MHKPCSTNCILHLRYRYKPLRNVFNIFHSFQARKIYLFCKVEHATSKETNIIDCPIRIEEIAHAWSSTINSQEILYLWSTYNQRYHTNRKRQFIKWSRMKQEERCGWQVKESGYGCCSEEDHSVLLSQVSQLGTGCSLLRAIAKNKIMCLTVIPS